MDGLVLRINYDFLTDLVRNGLTVGRLRVRAVPRSRSSKSYTFSSFADGATYLGAFSDAMLHPRFLCAAGPFHVIENLEVVAPDLRFGNSFRWYNITETRRLVTTSQYDKLRGQTYADAIERLRAYQDGRMEQYASDIRNAIEVRLGSYVDPCYVDAGYISPNSDPPQSL